MSTDRQLNTVTKFLRSAFVGNKKLTRLELRQLTVGGGDNLLERIVIEDSVYEPDKVQEMAFSFFETAQEDANGQRQPTQYCVVAFSGTEVIGRSPVFRLRSDETSNVLGETEPATEKGVLAQMMRHCEIMARQNAVMFETFTSQSVKVVERLSNQNEALVSEKLENIQLIEDLQSQRHTREIEAKKQLAKDKRQDELLRTVKPMVPHVINKFLGKGKTSSAGDSDNPLVTVMKQILSSLTPEEMSKIGDILGMRAAPLIDFYVEMKQKEEDSSEQAAE